MKYRQDSRKIGFPRIRNSSLLQGLTGFYSVNFKAYKAFYRISEGYIEVTRVLLAKREYIKVLFGEGE